MRLRSDFWVAAHLRRLAVAGVEAVLRRRGAAEAGAIFVVLDRLDGRLTLYGPAPQALVGDDGIRRFDPVLSDVDALAVEERLEREGRFDPDLWVLAVDDRAGRHGLDLVGEDRGNARP